jgi:hypothetical protein
MIYGVGTQSAQPHSTEYLKVSLSSWPRHQQQGRQLLRSASSPRVRCPLNLQESTLACCGGTEKRHLPRGFWATGGPVATKVPREQDFVKADMVQDLFKSFQV